MKVIDFITFCYRDLDACRVRLPPFSARTKTINNSHIGRTVCDSFLILKD